MANLKNSKTLFGFTSPRTIEKIVPEIQILVDGYEGKIWSGNEAHLIADDELYAVFHFVDQGFYVEFTGWKDSYGDSEYTDYKQVTPTTKTVTVYE